MSISGHGVIACCVEVRTPDPAVPAAISAGVQPDALTMLIKMLATLFEDNDAGTSCQSAGSTRSGPHAPDAAPLTVIDMQVSPSRDGMNVQPAMARAKLGLPFAAGPNAESYLVSVIDHLKAAAPNGVHVTVEQVLT